MQLKIYQRLNQILLGLIATMLVSVVLIVLNFNKIQGNTKYLIIAAFFVFSFVAVLAFKTLEMNWDRYLIQKMLTSGKIALAEIVRAEPLYHIKDSSSKLYMLYQLDVVMKDLDLESSKLTFYEKFNINVKKVPSGNVYITYDPKKPSHLFIVPNGMLARFHNLAPIVNFYETSGLKIKYLDVLVDDGLIIRTFKESIKAYEAQKEMEAADKQQSDRS